MPAAIGACDALVFPVTWEEPWGLVPLEAMATGRPVVAASSGGGAAEYLEPERNCLAFAPGDAAGLAGAVRRLADDEALRAALVRGGAATAGRLSERAFVEGLVAELERCRGGGGDPVTSRPHVSVIVPFAGSDDELRSCLDRLGQLALRAGDEVLVADNRPGSADGGAAHGVRIVAADGVRAPGFARNRAAALAHGEWLVFIDADTRPSGDLLERYFEPAPGERTAVLAGGIADVPGSRSSAARVRRAAAPDEPARDARSRRDAVRPERQHARCAPTPSRPSEALTRGRAAARTPTSASGWRTPAGRWRSARRRSWSTRRGAPSASCRARWPITAAAPPG